MAFRRRGERISVAAPPPGPLNVEFAWRIHGAQEAWTAKVDIKASLLLALVGGALFATVSGHAEGGLLSDLEAPFRTVEVAGVLLELGSLLLAAGAVFPMVGKTQRHEAAAAAGQVIYFGHLRHWTAGSLAKRLDVLTRDEQLAMLSEQLVSMGVRNWRKHRLLQWSLASAIVGIGLVAVCALWG